MGRFWSYIRRRRGWGLLAAAVALGFAVGTASTIWLSGPSAVAVGSVLAAALFGAVSARGKTLIEKRYEQQDALPKQIVAVDATGRLRRVREFDDPIALRVHPAAKLERFIDGRLVVDRVPPYVPRDIEESLRAAVRRGGFVLVVADSTSGKTRAAYEVVRALLPDYVLVAPVGRDSLATIVPTVLELHRCVVWLDDLERFLGPGGLTVNAITRMLGVADRQVLVLGTLRTAEFDRYSARQEFALTGAERESWRAARDVLALAVVVEMQRQWNRDELDRARRFIDDPRIRAALGQSDRFGLAELLAAGPELAQDWHNAWRAGAHPRGAALVAAAVDCRRAGVHEPMPIDLLEELAEHYLAQHGGILLRSEPLEEALAWACALSHGASSLLLPAGQEGHYLAFDYLIDLPGLPGVPEATWDALVEHATPKQAYDIGDAAVQRFQRGTAVKAYRKAADDGVRDADVALIGAIGAAGDPKVAIRMLTDLLADRERTLGPGNIDVFRIRRHLGFQTALAGELAAAADLSARLIADQQRVLGSDHPETLEARHLHAHCIVERGDYQLGLRLHAQLVADKQRVFGPDHPYTLNSRQHLSHWIGVSGDLKRAIELLADLVVDRERSLGGDNPRTFQTRHSLAEFIGLAGDPSRAAEMFLQLARDRERVLGPNHHHTIRSRLHLIRFTAQAGNHEQATTLFSGLLADRKQALGPSYSSAAVAQDLLTSATFGWSPGSQYAQQELLNLLEVCHQILGSEHPVTRETQRLLDERTLPTMQAEEPTNDGKNVDL